MTIKHMKNFTSTKKNPPFWFYHLILHPRTFPKLIPPHRSSQTEFKVSSKNQFKYYVLFAIFST